MADRELGPPWERGPEGVWRVVRSPTDLRLTAEAGADFWETTAEEQLLLDRSEEWQSYVRGEVEHYLRVLDDLR